MLHAVSPSSSAQTHHHIVLSDLKPDTYKTYTVVSARLYHTPFGAAHQDWTYSQLRGLLVFGRDRSTQTSDASSSGHGSPDASKYWFRLVDEISGRVVWKIGVPVGLDYQKDKPFFHIFPGKTRMFGFCFNRDDEAAEFFTKVTQRTLVAQKPLKVADTKKHKPSLSRKRRISTSIISAPSPASFVHVAHIGINENGTIEPSGQLDSSWGALVGELQGYGISQHMVEENLDFVEGFLAGAKSAKKYSNRKTVSFREPNRKMRARFPADL